MKDKLKTIGFCLLVLFAGASLFCNVKLWSDVSSYRTWGEAANKETAQRTEELSTCTGEVNQLKTEVANLQEEKAGLENQIKELNKTITNLKK